MAYLLVILVLAFVGLAIGLSPLLAVVLALPLFLIFLLWVGISRRSEARTGGGEGAGEHAPGETDSDPEPNAPEPPIY
jgi:hypothetical protein